MDVTSTEPQSKHIRSQHLRRESREEKVLTLWHIKASNEYHYHYTLYYAHDRREAKRLAQPFFEQHPDFPQHRLKPLPYGFPSYSAWWTPGQITDEGQDITPRVPIFEMLDPTVFEGCLHEEASARLTILNQAQMALLPFEDQFNGESIARKAARMKKRQLMWFATNSIALEYICSAHFWRFDRLRFDLLTRKPNCTYLEGRDTRYV